MKPIEKHKTLCDYAATKKMKRKSVDELPSWVLELRAAWSSELEKVRRQSRIGNGDEKQEDELRREALRPSFASEKDSALQTLDEDVLATESSESWRISSFLQALCEEKAAGPSALQQLQVSAWKLVECHAHSEPI